jgi:septal ring factor EnvC (AmiA/AmiB activator)
MKSRSHFSLRAVLGLCFALVFVDSAQAATSAYRFSGPAANGNTFVGTVTLLVGATPDRTSSASADYNSGTGKVISASATLVNANGQTVRELSFGTGSANATSALVQLYSDPSTSYFYVQIDGASKGVYFYVIGASRWLPNTSVPTGPLTGFTQGLFHDYWDGNAGFGDGSVTQLTPIEDIATLQARIADLQAQLAAANTQVNSLQTQLAAANQLNTSLTSQLLAANALTAGLQTQLTAANAQIATLTTDKTALQKQVSSLQSQINTQLQTIAALNAEVSQKALQIQALQATISQKTSENTALSSQILSLTASLNAAQAQIAGLAAQNAGLNNALSTAQAANAQLQQSLSAAHAENASLSAQLGAATTANSSLTAANTSLTADLAAANTQIVSLTNQLNAANASLASLPSQLATAFGVGGFNLPGATPTEQIQNLSKAINNLNPGQKKALYDQLAGKK